MALLYYEVRYLTGVMLHPVRLDVLRSDPVAGTASFLKLGPAQSVLRLRDEEAERMYQLLKAGNPTAAVCWPDIPEVVEQGDVPDIEEALTDGRAALHIGDGQRRG